jgi:hypothetical protein
LIRISQLVGVPFHTISFVEKSRLPIVNLWALAKEMFCEKVSKVDNTKRVNRINFFICFIFYKYSKKI